MPAPPRPRRQFLQTTVAVAAGLAGCFGDVDESPDTETADDSPRARGPDERAGTDDDSAPSSRDLRLIGTGYRTLDPVAATDPMSRQVVSQLYEGVTTFPAGVPEPEPLLAEEIQSTDGGTTYQIALRSGVEFHDPVGGEVTADDVRYSFERLAGSDYSAHAALLLDHLGVVHETAETVDGDASTEQYVPGSLAVEAVAEDTVELELTDPHHAVESILAHPAVGILPEGIVGDLPGYSGEVDYETFATESPVGTGPFRFDPDTPDGEYRVDARGSYYGDAPSVGGIRWTRVPDAETGYERAVAGEADVFHIPDAKYDPDDVTVVTIDDRGRRTGKYGPVEQVGEPLDYQQVCRLATRYLGLNPTRVPKPVRRAIAYAVNPAALVTDVYSERAEPALHLTPPALFPGGRDAALDHGESYPFGLQESRVDDARAELQSADYNPANSVAVTFTTDGSEAAIRTATKLRKLFGELPVDLSVETVAPATLRRRREAGELDIHMASHAATYPDVENVVRRFAPGTDAGTTDWGASGADADSVARAREAWRTFRRRQRDTEADREARAEAVRDVEEANWQDVVRLPLVHPLCEVVSYDYVDLPPTGATGFAGRTLTDVRVGPRD